MKGLFCGLSRCGLLLLLVGCHAGETTTMETASTPPEQPTNTVSRTDAEWKQRLNSEQYRILRQAGTERPFGTVYAQFKQQGAGTYYCAGCGAALFSSKEKFDSHCGWPSFYDPANASNVRTRDDVSLGQVRTEVLCAKCGGHLGHVFKGEGFNTPTDLRYCINGVALKFVPATSDSGKASPAH
jgi:peptide-methionine (R)-S-oxide reductase